MLGLLHLREFSTPVILDQARRAGSEMEKLGHFFAAQRPAKMLTPLDCRLARNGGRGSIEESEIFNLSPIAVGVGVAV